MLPHEEPSYLIIGAGVFGISTVLHLKRLQPHSPVRLLDRSATPCPSAASHDLNKIVRADYANPFYMKLALASMCEWRHNATFSPSYHESGIMIADNIGWGRQSVENYKLLNADVHTEIMSVEAAMNRFPVFANTDWDGADQCYWKPASGWAEAGKALEGCLKAAHGLGVEQITATVDSLLINDDGACLGARATDGSNYYATQVLLSAGAYTPKILLDTFPHIDENQIGDRMYAAGAVSCTASYDDSEANKIKGVPVLINTMPNTHGQCSVLPINMLMSKTITL